MKQTKYIQLAILAITAVFLTNCSDPAKKENQPEAEIPAQETKTREPGVILQGQTMKMTPDGTIELILNQNPSKNPNFNPGTALKLKANRQYPATAAFREKFEKELKFRNIRIEVTENPASPHEVYGDIWKKDAAPGSAPEN
jgi:hypothetical protein